MLVLLLFLALDKWTKCIEINIITHFGLKYLESFTHSIVIRILSYEYWARYKNIHEIFGIWKVNFNFFGGRRTLHMDCGREKPLYSTDPNFSIVAQWMNLLIVANYSHLFVHQIHTYTHIINKYGKVLARVHHVAVCLCGKWKLNRMKIKCKNYQSRTISIIYIFINMMRCTQTHTQFQFAEDAESKKRTHYIYAVSKCNLKTNLQTFKSLDLIAQSLHFCQVFFFVLLAICCYLSTL